MPALDGSTPFASLADVTAPSLMSLVCTALGRSCEEPTLFFGSFDTAYPVPLIEANRAMSATTMAGEGRQTIEPA